jgi:hypothetical protein
MRAALRSRIGEVLTPLADHRVHGVGVVAILVQARSRKD